MKRRAFLPLTAALAVAPRLARAQPAIPVIGILDPADPTEFVTEFRKALAELGHVEGRTIRLEIRSGESNPEIVARRAAELVQLKVSIIVTRLTTALRAAMRATTDIPIVMSGVGNPVELRLVASLARPGGNVTGMSLGGLQLSAKRVQIIREVLPAARRMAFIGNAGDPTSRLLLSSLEDPGRGVGLQFLPLIGTAEGLEALLGALARDRPDAVFTMTNLPEGPIAAFALKERLPLFATRRSAVEAGALLSYGGRLDDQYRGAAVYVDKILKGAKPASLPVEEPSRFELFINMKTVKALGLTLPRTLVAQAADLIE
jgi:putative ABC transport system substrate-binding protein